MLYTHLPLSQVRFKLPHIFEYAFQLISLDVESQLIIKVFTTLCLRKNDVPMRALNPIKDIISYRSLEVILNLNVEPHLKIRVYRRIREGGQQYF